MNNKVLAIKICAPAGSGVMQISELLCAVLNEAGFYSLAYPEYPSRIRGGDNNVQILISDRPELAPQNKVDVLFLLDENLRNDHLKDIKNNGQIFSTATAKIDALSEVKQNPFVKNTALAGYIWKTLGQDLAILTQQIEKKFRHKHLVENLNAAKQGYDLASKIAEYVLRGVKEKIINATGNKIMADFAVKAGCEYASIYPMTPITGLLSHLSKKIETITPEDEIFAALSTVGAAYAGKRALTATSGGGFCLMSEAIGLAGMAEIPFVVILGQRPGPSSGIPTYSAQADLNFAINVGQGEFPKIILAPGDLEETAKLTLDAFNLADIYQIPVIILTDKYLSENRFSLLQKTIEKIKIKIDRGKRFSANQKNYAHYQLTKDGVSPRAFPGETTFLTNSYEHDEKGFSTDNVEIRNKMMAKRMKKTNGLKGGFEIFGDKTSPTAIIGWGSTKTQILPLLERNTKYKYIHIWRVWPFPIELKRELKNIKKAIVIENNFSGQMAKIIQNETGVSVKAITKDDGRPFFQEELNKLIKQNL